MLENLRRKSLVKTYNDSRYSINFEQGHVIYLDLLSIAQHKQRLSKEQVDKPFPSTFDGRSKEFRLIANTLEDVQFNMIYCPSGTFIMGCIGEGDNPSRQETIERPFLLGETEITQELYAKVMDTNPSSFNNRSQNPIEQVSWYDAILFCNELSKLQGLDECYVLTDISTIDKKGVDQKRIMSAKVVCYFNKNGYRLPTEKEWEYAAKAGTDNQYAGTNKLSKVGEYAVCTENSAINGTKQTHPVKTKQPNEWGFYDMSGNVWEWCWDKYNPRSKASSADRVNRGGSWGSMYTGDLCSAVRSTRSPGLRGGYLGFRVCRSIVN